MSVKYIGDERVRILTAKFPEGYRRAIHITAVVCARTPRGLCMMPLLNFAMTKIDEASTGVMQALKPAAPDNKVFKHPYKT